eukprot:1884496-Rhodomonas_salina.1
MAFVAEPQHSMGVVAWLLLGVFIRDANHVQILGEHVESTAGELAKGIGPEKVFDGCQFVGVISHEPSMTDRMDGAVSRRGSLDQNCDIRVPGAMRLP